MIEMERNGDPLVYQPSENQKPQFHKNQQQLTTSNLHLLKKLHKTSGLRSKLVQDMASSGGAISAEVEIT